MRASIAKNWQALALTASKVECFHRPLDANLADALFGHDCDVQDIANRLFLEGLPINGEFNEGTTFKPAGVGVSEWVRIASKTARFSHCMGGDTSARVRGKE